MNDGDNFALLLGTLVGGLLFLTILVLTHNFGMGW